MVMIPNLPVEQYIPPKAHWKLHWHENKYKQFHKGDSEGMQRKDLC